MTGERYGAARLGLEQLDRRDVPAASLALRGQLLVITGDVAQDVVMVTNVGTSVQITVNGQALPLIPRGAIQGIIFDGGAGDDVFANLSSLPSAAFGGEGNDILVGGSAFNWLQGGNGNDVLVGGAGPDLLVGEAGDDVIFGGPGRDFEVGGDGRDRFPGGHDVNDAFDDHGLDPNDVFDDNGNDGPNHR